MQPLPAQITRRFMHAFWGVRQTIVRRVNPLLIEQHGLELAELFLLEYIATTNLAPGEIAAAMSLPAHAISRRLDALERRGWIRREIDPDDNRRRRLSPTASGRSTLKAAQQTLYEVVGNLLAALEGDRCDCLIDGMEALARNPAADGKNARPAHPQEVHEEPT